ncbi:MAG: hypothetical protein J6A05_05230 [Oscillospiraceae bacterium]|nr:hypothetical protein [Oscillospiraceae bacterium]
MKFYSKADTLKQLQNKVRCAVILPMTVISRNDIADRNKLKESIAVSGLYEDVIVRSSAAEEDASGNTHAGEFLSIIGVSGLDEVADAVYRVFASYNKNGRENHDDDVVFIQQVLRDCQYNGVIFTRQPDTGAEYYVINYSKSDIPDKVTSGSSDGIIEYVLCKGKKCSDQQFSKVIKASSELEEMLECDCLDIEFAIKDDCVYVFQVRRLMVNEKIREGKSINLDMIKAKLEYEANTRSFAKGRMLYGVMPDWNPAELIGIRPKPLSLSLYMKLVTDKAWDIERSRLGYKDISSEALIKDIYGIPYVDVITSLFSFVPASISDKTALKLTEYYADTLKKHTEWHDKLEYNVTIDCLYDAPDAICKRLESAGFTHGECIEVINAVSGLTTDVISDENYIADKVTASEKIEALREECMASDMPLKDKLRTLMEITEEYGTIPFSGLARCAFIGTKILKQFVDRGVISYKEYSDFMKGIHTISHSMYDDFYALEKSDFIKKYGFVRPGMYDILSLRYDDENAVYFGNNQLTDRCSYEEYIPERIMLDRIDDEFRRMKLNISAENFLKFAADAVKAREYVKFLFSHSLSDILECVKEYGYSMDIPPEDMAYCRIEQLYEPDIINRINEAKAVYSDCLLMYLPQMIFASDDVYEFCTESCQPSYISGKDISGEIIRPENCSDITGKIVLLEAADPGMDWIFTHNIKGLITAYGGSNSHMAIRAFEHGIAAVIGIGRTMFRRLADAKYVRLNCECKKIEVLGIENNIM